VKDYSWLCYSIHGQFLDSCMMTLIIYRKVGNEFIIDLTASLYNM